MAQFKVYSLEDVKAGVFNLPFFAPGNVQALRLVEQLVNDSPEAMPARHPGDFRVVYLGDFNDQTGEFSMSEERGNIAWCSELKRPGTDPRQLSLVPEVKS